MEKNTTFPIEDLALFIKFNTPKTQPFMFGIQGYHYFGY